jgi:hypothetical protein
MHRRWAAARPRSCRLVQGALFDFDFVVLVAMGAADVKRGEVGGQFLRLACVGAFDFRVDLPAGIWAAKNKRTHHHLPDASDASQMPPEDG